MAGCAAVVAGRARFWLLRQRRRFVARGKGWEFVACGNSGQYTSKPRAPAFGSVSFTGIGRPADGDRRHLATARTDVAEQLRSLRLEAQDVALSRLKHGFESRRERHFVRWAFHCAKDPAPAGFFVRAAEPLLQAR